MRTQSKSALPTMPASRFQSATKKVNQSLQPKVETLASCDDETQSFYLASSINTHFLVPSKMPSFLKLSPSSHSLLMKVDRHEKEYECTHIYHQADSRAGAKIVESAGDAQTTTFLSYGQSGTGKSWILGTALDSELDSTVISSLLDIITYPI